MENKPPTIAVTALVNATADMMVCAVMYIFITSTQKKNLSKLNGRILVFVRYMIVFPVEHCYTVFVTVPISGDRKGVLLMNLILNYFISVLASVTAYYICKWLDGINQR